MKAFDTIPRKTAITIMALAAMACAASLFPKSPAPITAANSPIGPAGTCRRIVRHAESRYKNFLAHRPARKSRIASMPRCAAPIAVKNPAPSPVSSTTVIPPPPPTPSLPTSAAFLQARFGDAGHGALLIAKPWAWYGHAGIELAGSGWKIQPASQSREHDGIHGLGGVSFHGGPGATSRVTLPDDLHTEATVTYLAQPGGGAFSVRTGDTELIKVDTAADDKHLGFASFPTPHRHAHLDFDRYLRQRPPVQLPLR